MQLLLHLPVKNLPEKQRKLGIFYGALGAIVPKSFNGLLCNIFIIDIWSKNCGGILLIWIGFKLCIDHQNINEKTNIQVQQDNKLLKYYKDYNSTDFVMSLDNSLAIAAAADGNIYIVVFGLLLKYSHYNMGK